ncbi:hypothetical protein [Nesterenkonia pannonica]|uniref:hypothetical protein n=1 Tax=Nesterenkonia pannonica TaxID=1548602 RepID=UPI002164DD94|nr:hypothetical protein [Nesterenkonia pannonica]
MTGSPRGRAVISEGAGASFHWRNGVSNINHRLARQIVPQKEVVSRILRASGVNA